MIEILVGVHEAKDCHGVVAAMARVGIRVDVSSGYDTKRLDELRGEIEDRLNAGLAEAILPRGGAE